MSKFKAVVLGRNHGSLLAMVRAAGLANCDVVVIRTVRKILSSRIKKFEIEASSKFGDV